MSRKRVFFLIFGGIVALGIAAGAVYMFGIRQKEQKQEERPSFPKNGIDGEYVSATGTTVAGISTEELEIDFLEDTDLAVEEVYLQNGDTVTTGTKYIKFTDDSIADARKELEDTVLNTELTYRNQVISTQESKIKAEYTYKKAAYTGEQAQTVYDEKIAELEQAVEQAQKAYEEAQDALTELQESLSGGYLEEYEIDQKKKAYEDSKEIYQYLLDKWDKTDDDVSDSGSNASAAAQGPGMQKNQDETWINKTLVLAKEEYEESEDEYEQAQEDLDKALQNYEYQLKKAQNEVDQSSAAYEKAKLALQTEGLSAKTELETSKAKASTAKAEYDTELSSLNEALEKLKEEAEDAAENLQTFETEAGDGYLYTKGAGTIMRVMIREGDTLEGSEKLIAYQDSSQMTVSVSVSQDSISQLTVGEKAYIKINDVGEYDGEISYINPVATSTGRSSVTYTVEVKLDGDISELTPNLTATVVFGADKETMQKWNEEHKQTSPKGMEDGQQPSMQEGMEDGQQPPVQEGMEDGQQPPMQGEMEKTDGESESRGKTDE